MNTFLNQNQNSMKLFEGFEFDLNSIHKISLIMIYNTFAGFIKLLWLRIRMSDSDLESDMYLDPVCTFLKKNCCVFFY